jgi:hyperosmotically inducible protein
MRALTAVALIVAFAAALAAGRALGQPASEAPGQHADFSGLDRNQDGYVSRVEALADREIHKRFAEFDANKDGLLSEREHRLAMDDRQKRVLQDALITARVKAKLMAERTIPSVRIGVETYEGRVQLSGFVPSAELASRAGRLTASVNGVRTVDNNLGVR